MTAIAVQTQLTPEEYLAWERKAPFKNEYLSRQILAKSGANRTHNLITGNIFNGLYNQLVNRDCETYTWRNAREGEANNILLLSRCRRRL